MCLGKNMGLFSSSRAKQSTRSNSSKYDPEFNKAVHENTAPEDLEFKKEVEALHDENKPEIKLEFDKFMGVEGKNIPIGWKITPIRFRQVTG